MIISDTSSFSRQTVHRTKQYDVVICGTMDLSVIPLVRRLLYLDETELLVDTATSLKGMAEVMSFARADVPSVGNLLQYRKSFQSYARVGYIIRSVEGCRRRHPGAVRSPTPSYPLPSPGATGGPDCLRKP